MNKTNLLKINNRMIKDAGKRANHGLAGVCVLKDKLYATNGYIAFCVDGDYSENEEITKIPQKDYPVSVIKKAFEQFEENNFIIDLDLSKYDLKQESVQFSQNFFDCSLIRFALQVIGKTYAASLATAVEADRLKITGKDCSALILPLRLKN